jgi:ureidoacrylate peracid hydrolase
MPNLKFDKEITALLVIRSLQRFHSRGRQNMASYKRSRRANTCVPNMLQALDAARKAGLRVFYAMHHRYRPGDYETWKYIAPIQKRSGLIPNRFSSTMLSDPGSSRSGSDSCRG